MLGRDDQADFRARAHVAAIARRLDGDDFRSAAVDEDLDRRAEVAQKAAQEPEAQPEVEDSTVLRFKLLELD
jgi:hypothetical protein